jgi:hypothetical protein
MVSEIVRIGVGNARIRMQNGRAGTGYPQRQTNRLDPMTQDRSWKTPMATPILQTDGSRDSSRMPTFQD